MQEDDDISTTSRSTMGDDGSISDDSQCDDDGMDMSEVHLLQQRMKANLSSQSLSTTATNRPSRMQQASAQHRQRAMTRHSSVRTFCQHKPLKAIQTVNATAPTPGDFTPNDHLCKLLDTKLDRVPYEGLGDYFLKTTKEHIAAWDGELLRAVRSQDLPLLKKMHAEGKPLQACNQFSESILHVAVRRGSPEILNYLLRQGNVCPRVRCDYGRTPLHDALWTFDGSERSLKICALLLRESPEMLLVTDKRGFIPLDYVPRDRWSACCKFLDRCLPFLSKLRNNGRGGAAA